MRAQGGLYKGAGGVEGLGGASRSRLGSLVKASRKRCLGWDAIGTVVQSRLVCLLLSPRGLRGGLKCSGIRMRPPDPRKRGLSSLGLVPKSNI